MFLYLLKFRDGRRFKIGRTMDVYGRAKSLGLGLFDFETSEAFEGSDRVIKLLERQLHLDFENYRCEAEELSSGYTEVFSISCWTRVLEEIQAKQEKFPHLELRRSNTSVPVLVESHQEDRVSKGRKIKPNDPIPRRVNSEGVREFIDTIAIRADRIEVALGQGGKILGFLIRAARGRLGFRPMIEIEGRRNRMYSALFDGYGMNSNESSIWFFSAINSDQFNRYHGFIFMSLRDRCVSRVDAISSASESYLAKQADSGPFMMNDLARLYSDAGNYLLEE